MAGSSATLPRNREAMRIRARARKQQQEADPSFARIAEALQQPEEPWPSRVAVFTALGAVFGFAIAWLLCRSVAGWYLFVALGMTVGALVGAIVARLGKGGEPSDPSRW